MSNIGKYMWGEDEESFYSDIFNSIAECKNDIAVNLPYIPSGDILIGQITREYDFEELAQDVQNMIKDRATEFDAYAELNDISDELFDIIKDNLDMREFKVRTVEKVKLEDLL
jgi:hypothetical protein